LHVDCVLAALVNRATVAEYLASSKLSYWQLIAAGTDGHVAGEDTITAGAIIDHLLTFPGNRSIFLDDSAWLALDCWRHAADSPKLSSYLMKYLGAVHLIQAGYEKDILFASKLDFLPVVPRRLEIDLDHHMFHRLC
jgi:phosphosulfolactate phosphohydrolase-like enzyme